MPLKNRGSEGALNAPYQNDGIFIKSLTNCKKEVGSQELELAFLSELLQLFLNFVLWHIFTVKFNPYYIVT